VCVACDTAVAKDRFVMEGIGAAMKAFQFHVRCFYYWDSLRKVPGRDDPADPDLTNAPPPPSAAPMSSAPSRTLRATAAGAPSS
jgi:hypothetical protein